MGWWGKRVILAAWALVVVVAAREASADCGGQPEGWTLESHSGGTICNACKEGKAGAAVTLEYFCKEADAQAVFEGKTRSGAVENTSDEVLIRESGGFSGYCGVFPEAEKMFLRIDPRTLATIYVMGGEEWMKSAGARALVGWARAVAQSNESLRGNCPDDTPSGDPALRVDRSKGARFGAIQVFGSGFSPNTHVNLVWQGKEIARVDRTTAKGAFPGGTWMWVPDDAPPGDNELWAEEGESGKRTAKLHFTVEMVPLKTVVDHFDSIVERYMKIIPAKTASHLYLLADPLKENWYKGHYPSTGGSYYDQDEKRRLVGDRAAFDEAAPTSVVVQSPVTLEVRSAQGKRIALGADGKLTNDIADSAAVAIPKNGEPGYVWLIALPAGKHDVTITAIADGSYRLRTRAGQGTIKEDPVVRVAKGDVHRVVVGGDAPPSAASFPLPLGLGALPLGGAIGGGVLVAALLSLAFRRRVAR